MVVKEEIIDNVVALKVLACLKNEDLRPLMLLYKMCLIDFNDTFSINSIRNINAFAYYLQKYRTVLNELFKNKLIKANNEKLSISFDGICMIEKMKELEVVESFLKSCELIEQKIHDNDYQKEYIAGLDNFTKYFFESEAL